MQKYRGEEGDGGALLTSSTVSHLSYAPPFQGPHYLTKMLESNILYDNLLIDILSVWWNQKKYRKHSCESFWNVKGKFDKKTLVQPERLYFLLRFALRIILGDRCDRKQKKLFYSSKTFFLIVEVNNTVTF